MILGWMVRFLILCWTCCIQRKMSQLKMYFLVKMAISHCHVSLPGCIYWFHSDVLSFFMFFVTDAFAIEASSFNQLQDATTLGKVEGRYHGKLVQRG